MIPTAYGRDGDRLLLHGAAANHVLKAAADGAELTVTVTLVDGLVLARSTFHHSINYRSVVIFGRATDIDDPDEKAAALALVVDHMLPGRTDDARVAQQPELASTRVVSLPLDEVSAKVRTGGPIDDDEDLALPVWAGVLPLRRRPGPPRRRMAPCVRSRLSHPIGALDSPTLVSVQPWVPTSGRASGRSTPCSAGGRALTAGYLIEGPAPGAGRDRQPDVGAGPAGRPGRARRGARATWPAWRSPTSISTTPAASATWPGPSRRPPCTCTRRAPATWSTRSAWSARPARSTATCSTRSTAGSSRPRPSGSTCSRTARPIEIGAGRTLTTVDSPGHAKHHLALHDSESGILFAGDAVGVRLPDAGVLRPATPPADFDLDQAVTRCGSSGPGSRPGWPWPTTASCPSPWTCSRRPRGSCASGRRWPRRPGGRARTSPPPSTTRSPPTSTASTPSTASKLETLNGIHSNAAGLRRWLETTKGDPDGPAP